MHPLVTRCPARAILWDARASHLASSRIEYHTPLTGAGYIQSAWNCGVRTEAGGRSGLKCAFLSRLMCPAHHMTGCAVPTKPVFGGPRGPARCIISESTESLALCRVREEFGWIYRQPSLVRSGGQMLQCSAHMRVCERQSGGQERLDVL
jgi:hypothetical protein